MVDLNASTAVTAAAILVVLTLLADFVMENAATKERELQVFARDDVALEQLLSAVHERPPTTADLLEYSAMGALPLLTALGQTSATRSIRLLVCHPEAAISEYQRSVRLAEGLKSLAKRIPKKSVATCGLEIRCYRERASIRGRLLDREWLLVGWYTYDDRGRTNGAGADMSGGTNPSVLGSPGQESGAQLLTLFSRVFENLWQEAEPADQAWQPYREQLPQLPPVEWMNAVSQRRGH
ncbi:MAG: hypothetical protein ABSE70_05115 [Candidatus Limnocylindrales bacterium]